MAKTTLATQSTKQPQSARGHSVGIPLETLIHYAKKGWTHEQIAHKVGCSRINVTKRFMRAGFSTDRLEHHKANKKDVLEFVQSTALNEITVDKLKKSTAKDLAVVVGIMQDQIAKVDAPAQVTYESLNIALNQAITIINANREKMKAFRKEYELNR